jgi:GTPase SAR1 family protein
MKNPMTNIKCSTGEIAPTYKDYLQTKHWKELRLKVAKEKEHRCERCFGTFLHIFHVHHNTYKSLGREKMKDLGFYCNKCHSSIHSDRKNVRAFNKSYSNLLSQKMSKLNSDQIERVLAFIDNI